MPKKYKFSKDNKEETQRLSFYNKVKVKKVGAHKFRKGDIVKVISGSSKNKIGKILAVSENLCFVENTKISIVFPLLESKYKENILNGIKKNILKKSRELYKKYRGIHHSNLRHLVNGVLTRVKLIYQTVKDVKTGDEIIVRKRITKQIKENIIF